MLTNMRAIAPIDLSKVWPEIRHEVAEIEAPDGFIPEDAYAMCKSAQASLFFLEVEGKRVGWMICRLLGADLHIWMVRAETGYDVLHTFRGELMQLARSANATKLTYGSTRKAWAKVAPDHGFSIRMVVYECPVEPLHVCGNGASIPNIAIDDGAPDNDKHATH